jgi:hypothetical protein
MPDLTQHGCHVRFVNVLSPKATTRLPSVGTDARINIMAAAILRYPSGSARPLARRPGLTVDWGPTMRLCPGFIAVLFACVEISSPTNLGAQTKTGVVRGLVFDTASQIIVGAIIRVRSTTSEFSATTSSDREGRYVFDSIPAPGSYQISIRRLGYQATRDSFRLAGDDTVRVNFELMPVPTELDTALTASRSSTADVAVSRREILSFAAPDVVTVLWAVRPALMESILGRGPGYKGCPKIEKVYVDSVLVGTNLADGLKFLDVLDPRNVRGVEYVDCWRYDVDALSRNALWITTVKEIATDAATWVTAGIMTVLQTRPLAQSDGTKIAMAQMFGIDVGLEFRLAPAIVGRASVGATFFGQRLVRPEGDCTVCPKAEYNGGQFGKAGLDIILRGGQPGFGLGLSIGARIYRFPSAESDDCELCVATGLVSGVAPFCRPYVRFTVGRSDATTLDLGPYVSRYRQSTMIDWGLALNGHLPVRRVPLRR